MKMSIKMVYEDAQSGATARGGGLGATVDDTRRKTGNGSRNRRARLSSNASNSKIESDESTEDYHFTRMTGVKSVFS